MITSQNWIRRYRKIILISFLMVSFVLSLWISFGLGYRVMFNTTHSLPHVMYLTNPKTVFFKHGDIIAFPHNASKNTVIKRVIGVEGDLISQKQKAIVVHDLELALKDTRSNGDSLTPLKIKVIPKGMVFVAGEHSDSFDSRYDEFGLISVSDVKGQVWPVF